MTGFSDFEDLLLVAAYLTTEDTGEDYLRLSEIFSKYPLEYKDHWVMRALQSIIDSGYSDDARHLGGDVLGQPVSLTSSGFRRAEELLASGIDPRVDTLGFAGVAIPASDRIVTLGHNEAQQIDSEIGRVLSALESDNGDPDQPGLRERLIGQIKAGRELIKAGIFRAYILYESLVRGLGEIIEKYKNGVLIALANAVLGAIVSQIFAG